MGNMGPMGGMGGMGGMDASGGGAQFSGMPSNGGGGGAFSGMPVVILFQSTFFLVKNSILLWSLLGHGWLRRWNGWPS